MADTIEMTRDGENLYLRIMGCALCPLNSELCKSGVEAGCIVPGILLFSLRKTFEKNFWVSAKAVKFKKTDVGDCDWVFYVKLEPRR